MTQLQRASLVVLTGPTAVGKGTVSAYIREHYPEVWLSVSMTTRHPRPGEINGKHYHFVNQQRFNELVEQGEFLEYAVLYGRASYGTPRGPVLQAAAEGKLLLLEIDLQGVRQVRERILNPCCVFLAPPSWGELVHRLIGRGTESEVEREIRLATARHELSAQTEFDTVIVNDDLQRAAEELVHLIQQNVCVKT